MFNLLLDILPTTVIIDNKEYKINSDFRTSILFELLIQDDEIRDDEKIALALDLYYGKNIPKNLSEAINKIVWFYSNNQDREISNNKNSKATNGQQIYSYEYDSEYIYSAFLYQYNIDLNSIQYLHWWKFKAMFKSLKEDNLISKIISYRSIDLSEIKDDEEKARYKKLKEIYKLPNKYEKEDNEKIREIEAILMNKTQ